MDILKVYLIVNHIKIICGNHTVLRKATTLSETLLCSKWGLSSVRYTLIKGCPLNRI
jgi:hypothetical protein